MEVLSHLIFELVKIAILASFYASIVLLLFLVLGKLLKPENWFEKATAEKFKLWMQSGFIVSILLFIYMFTYWGNHGLGDGPRIPIGYGYAIDNTNWTPVGYLSDVKTCDNIHIETTEFLIVENSLLGNLNSSFYTYKNQYFILDMKEDKLLEFKSEEQFNEYLSLNDLPQTSEFLSFEQNYRKNWSGWRFWLLP